jgi:hypothetical protein
VITRKINKRRKDDNIYRRSNRGNWAPAGTAAA